jgi:hypothetical protein
MDLRWGFNNLRIREGDEVKAAFLTHRGLFEPLVMMFGLCNAPASFQTMMNSVLKEEIATGKVVVYVDDILIFTKDLEELRRLTRQVVSKLQKNRLFLKPEKCEFERTKVEFLGLIISENLVEMSPKKLETIRLWPTPRKKQELQQFLGFANFY